MNPSRPIFLAMLFACELPAIAQMVFLPNSPMFYAMAFGARLVQCEKNGHLPKDSAKAYFSKLQHELKDDITVPQMDSMVHTVFNSVDNRTVPDLGECSELASRKNMAVCEFSISATNEKNRQSFARSTEARVTRGELDRPCLGIVVKVSIPREICEDGASSQIRIVDVLTNSPSSRAGIEVGDAVKKIGSRDVRFGFGVLAEENKLTSGESIDLVLERNGIQINKTLTVGKIRDDESPPRCDTDR